MPQLPRFYDTTVPPVSPRAAERRVEARRGQRALIRWRPSRLLAQPIFRTYPFTLGVASGDPWPDGVVLWTRLAPEPLEGGGMPAAEHRSGVGSRRESAFRTIVQKGVAVARPELGHSVHVEVDRARAGARVLVSLSRRQRSQPDRAHGDGAGGRRRRRSAALWRVRLQPLRDRLLHRLPAISPRSGSISSSTPATTSTRGAAARRATPRSCAIITARRSTRSSTIAIATRSTSRIPICMAAHASAPFIVSWDDHEVDNDYAGDSRRERHAAGGLPAAARGRVSGLLRAHAAAQSAHADRAATAAVSPPAVRQR